MCIRLRDVGHSFRRLCSRFPVQMDAELSRLLSDANRELGTLDARPPFCRTPSFWWQCIAPEAVLSSQIEGTQSTLEDVLGSKLTRKARPPARHQEVVGSHSRSPVWLGAARSLPLSLRLICVVHEKLLEGVHGCIAHRRIPDQPELDRPVGLNLNNATSCHLLFMRCIRHWAIWRDFSMTTSPCRR